MEDSLVFKFVELIINLNESDIAEKEFLTEPKNIVNEIIDIATVIFIDAEGCVNYKNIIECKKYGIYIYCIEQDRFGWLIGGIQTNKGIIRFG